MLARVAADAVLLVHFAFVAFVVLGGSLLARWPAVAWGHAPAVIWAVMVEVGGLTCPLTPLEVALRRAAGQGGYSGDFIEHYVLALLYPDGLTRPTQIALGTLVVLVNVVIYALAAHRTYAQRHSSPKS